MKLFICFSLIYSTTNFIYNTIYDYKSKQFIVTCVLSKLYAEDFEGCIIIENKNEPFMFEKVKENQEYMELYNIHISDINLNNISKYDMFSTSVKNDDISTGTLRISTDVIRLTKSIEFKQKINQAYSLEIDLCKRSFLEKKIEFIITKIKEIKSINRFAQEKHEINNQSNDIEYKKKINELESLKSETDIKLRDLVDLCITKDDDILSKDLEKYFLNKLDKNSDDFEQELYIYLIIIKEIHSKYIVLKQELDSYLTDIKPDIEVSKKNQKSLLNEPIITESSYNEVSAIDNKDKKEYVVKEPNNFIEVSITISILCILTCGIYYLSSLY